MSKLGIDYTLGQDVTLSVSIAARENSALGKSHPVNVVRTYQLVGIIKEYTDVWTWATKPVCELDGTSSRAESGISATLCSALLTENACAEIVRQAQLQAEAFNNAEKEQGSDLRIKLCDAPTTNFSAPGSIRTKQTLLQECIRPWAAFRLHSMQQSLRSRRLKHTTFSLRH